MRIGTATNPHDYRDKYWGHDYVWMPEENGVTGTIQGWGSGIKKGDFILLKLPTMPQGSRYKFTRLQYYLDPPDMFNGRLIFAPRTREEAEEYNRTHPHKTSLEAFLCD